ncbi:MAG: hypothetical protein ABH834_07850 [Candidatus Altiarchaeota archaeon]
MRQRIRSLSTEPGFRGKVEAAFGQGGKEAVLTAAGGWGDQFRGYAVDVIEAAVKDDSPVSICESRRSVEVSFTPPKDTPSLLKTVGILKAASEQVMRVPDGAGGVRDVEGSLNNCMGPVLLHLHQNAWRADAAKIAPAVGDVGVMMAAPYYSRMDMVELMSHMADGQMLPDWSYLVLHHGKMASEALMLPYVAADAVLRNGWGVAECSRLSNLVEDHFAPAYSRIMGGQLGGGAIMLDHSLEESAVGFGYEGDGQDRKYAVLFNTGSVAFTSENIMDAANAELPMNYAQMLLHRLIDYQGVLPASAFRDGGTHAHLEASPSIGARVARKPNLGVVLPEVDFEALTEKTGLSEDDVANKLHRLTGAKLGLELARHYVYGGTRMSETQRSDEFIRSFNLRQDALIDADADLNALPPAQLRRLYEANYGPETDDRLAWNIALNAVDYAVLSEHKDAASNPALAAQVGERMRRVRSSAERNMEVLGGSYDFDGVVGDLRKAYRGVKLELR